MRISDWSSDVCSSDLVLAQHNGQLRHRDELQRVHEIDDLARRPLALRLQADDEARVVDQKDDRDVVGIAEHEEADDLVAAVGVRSEEHTSELQSLMRTSYADFCL